MERHDVVVLGAGLAGLTAGLAAARAGASVQVVEAHHLAGRAATDQREGYAFNRGPHALYEVGAGMEVLHGLGIDPAGVAPPLGDAYVRIGRDLHQAPLGPVGLARTRALGLRSKARLGLVLRKIGTTEPASVAHLSARQFYDSLEMAPDLDALMCLMARLSSYCSTLELVSADVVVGQISAASKGVRYLHGGWIRLCEQLRAGIEAAGGTVTVQHPARRVHTGGGGVVVTTDAGELHAHSAVLAVGGPSAAAALLEAAPSAWSALAPPVTAACLDLGLDRSPVRPVVLGVDRADYAICHGPPADLAPAGRAVVHAMRYLPAEDSADAETLRVELHDLAASMGIGTVCTERFSRRMVVVGAHPTPSNGGLAGRPTITSTGIEGVFVAGDWVGPDGFLADASLVSGHAAGLAAARRRDPVGAQ